MTNRERERQRRLKRIRERRFADNIATLKHEVEDRKQSRPGQGPVTQPVSVIERGATLSDRVQPRGFDPSIMAYGDEFSVGDFSGVSSAGVGSPEDSPGSLGWRAEWPDEFVGGSFTN